MRVRTRGTVRAEGMDWGEGIGKRRTVKPLPFPLPNPKPSTLTLPLVFTLILDPYLYARVTAESR
jgi:hypothetical protein